MTLRYALLALLTAQPMTGYDLAKSFHSSVGHVWHAPDSQIYPELRRMQIDGVITGESVAWGPNSSKTQYAITDAGVAALREWLSIPPSLTSERYPAHLRAAYFEWAEPGAALLQLTAHREHYEGMREQWSAQIRAIQDRTHPVVARRLEIFPEADWPKIIAYKKFAYEGLVEHANQQIAWAERGIALVSELEGL